MNNRKRFVSRYGFKIFGFLVAVLFIYGFLSNKISYSLFLHTFIAVFAVEVMFVAFFWKFRLGKKIICFLASMLITFFVFAMCYFVYQIFGP